MVEVWIWLRFVFSLVLVWVELSLVWYGLVLFEQYNLSYHIYLHLQVVACPRDIQLCPEDPQDEWEGARNLLLL